MKQKVALDSTAILERYIPGKNRDLVLDELTKSDYWIATELVKTEVLLTLHPIPTYLGKVSRPPKSMLCRLNVSTM